MTVVARLLGDLPDAPHGPDEPVVALTFDDGPGPWTDAVVDALGESEVPATFFVVGQACEEQPAVLARVAAAGHTIGCHSWSHTRLATLGDDDVRDEYARTGDLVGAATGRPTVLARPPFRRSDARRLASIIAPMGWRAVVTWSVDPRDWSERAPSAIVESVTGALHPGAIVVLHDGGDDRRATAAAVPGMVAEGRALGYRFVAL